MESVDVFESAGDALNYLSGLPARWACAAQVFNAGKGNEGAYSYAVATVQPLNAVSSVPGREGYRWDILIHGQVYVHDTENWLAAVDGRVVIELRHSSGVGVPNIAETEAYLQRALAKVGLLPPTPAAAATP